MDLGRIGVWAGAFSAGPAAHVRRGLREVEELGYGAVWYPEGLGSKDALANAALLLSWSERVVVASGIANVYARDPTAAANGARALDDAYPGRFLLGLGVSHAPAVERRGSNYGKPIATMRAYLDGMAEAPYHGGSAQPPVALAALGPRMLELAAERTLGAHPYFVPVEHTAFARARLGPEALLLVEQAVLLETDPARARAAAREHMERYLLLPNYRSNLLRVGFSEQELAGGGSDRLADAIVAWGGLDAIRERVRAHLEAGADHVCVQALGSPYPEVPVDALRELAPALLEL